MSSTIRSLRAPVVGGAITAVLLAACGGETPSTARATATRVDGAVVTLQDTTVPLTLDAAGVAEPLQRATLSTKLMGTVTEVLVKEGDRVSAGQLLVRLDARDLAAKEQQVAASVAEAEAMLRDAETQAGRIRALYADSAATRAQLDQVETGLARAQAGVRAARAAATELGAVSSYAAIRAPFAGIVTKRFVDPGAFAAPGAPLVAVQDASQLRIAVHVAPDAVRDLRRGGVIEATIEGRPVRATIEGIVPAMAGNLYTINAIVPNREGAHLAGSAATVLLPTGSRSALVVPAAAVTREGDLTGVRVRGAATDDVRWVRLGRAHGDVIEVETGLRAGEQVVVPAQPVTTASAAGRDGAR
jgi:RND family efflux transporter MFP subunit